MYISSHNLISIPPNSSCLLDLTWAICGYLEFRIFPLKPLLPFSFCCLLMAHPLVKSQTLKPYWISPNLSLYFILPQHLLFSDKLLSLGWFFLIDVPCICSLHSSFHNSSWRPSHDFYGLMLWYPERLSLAVFSSESSSISLVYRVYDV